MTTEPTPNPARNLARDTLPWVVGAVALVVYLLTLNHWVNLSNLNLAVRISGWDWQPVLSQPLLYLVTLPFRLLPVSWVPFALNAFTAACAALTLLTLARSVSLLPHNRVEAQRLLAQDEVGLLSQPNAWVPVSLAALALGLQLTFWEHSIAASGEMLDLLLFAYIIRCLLEYRLREERFWLDRAAVLFGVSLANSWAMATFLPLFVFAVLRTKRLSFFSVRTIQRIDRDGWEKVKPALKTDVRFFLRMTLLGLAGLAFFLLLPLVQALTPGSPLSFWQSLQTAAVSYETALHLFARLFLRQRLELTLLLAAASLLPVLLLSIRWGSLGTREGSGQFDLASLILHIAHAFLFLVCLWVMFDPPFSPRQIAQQNGLPFAFLPLYYLTALSLGYYSGFFLLLFGPVALQRISRRYATRRAFYPAIPVLVYLLAVLLVTGMLLLNVRAIQAGKAPHLDRYAKLAAGALPPGGAMLFSEDPGRLAVVMAELAREGKAALYLPVDSRSLPQYAYRAWLSRKYPGRWPDPAKETGSALSPVPGFSGQAPLDALAAAQLVANIAQSNAVYWLQPTVSRLFDYFYLQPHGLVQEMKPYTLSGVGVPPLAPAELVENESFWQGAIETAVKPVLQLASQTELPRPAFEADLMKRGHLRTPPPPQIRVLAWWYSAALNRWGVTLQQNGQWSNATPCFTLAKELKADNQAAAINLQCNSNFLAHQPMAVARNLSADDLGSKYRTLNQLLAENGPVDEPSYSFYMGMGFSQGGMLRQGLQQLERVRDLVPDDIPVRLIMGDYYNNAGRPDQALRVVSEIQTDPKLHPLGRTNEIELAFLEARSWYSLTNRAKAEAIIYSLLGFNPGDAALRERAVATFTAYQSYPQAQRLLDRQLQQCPEDSTALMQKGNLCMMTGDYSNAVPLLTRALSLTNAYSVRFSRSMAYLRAGQLDAAEGDCQELLKSFPDFSRTYIGLGEIAQQKKDTNSAIQYYQQYLAKVGVDNEETRVVAARLRYLLQSQR
jgi:tetratricopeptide (TPR) repeat protein